MTTNPPKILVVYHTSEGQTARIAGRIASTLRRHGDAVDLHEVEDAPPPQGYDGIVVGDPIHAVKHSRALIRYLEAHQEAIDAMPSAFFQVSLTSANPDAEHT